MIKRFDQYNGMLPDPEGSFVPYTVCEKLLNALQRIAAEHCVYHKGGVACAETDVPVEKYCAPCYARSIINSLKDKAEAKT